MPPTMRSIVAHATPGKSAETSLHSGPRTVAWQGKLTIVAIVRADRMPPGRRGSRRRRSTFPPRYLRFALTPATGRTATASRAGSARCRARRAASLTRRYQSCAHHVCGRQIGRSAVGVSCGDHDRCGVHVGGLRGGIAHDRRHLGGDIQQVEDDEGDRGRRGSQHRGADPERIMDRPRLLGPERIPGQVDGEFQGDLGGGGTDRQGVLLAHVHLIGRRSRSRAGDAATRRGRRPVGGRVDTVGSRWLTSIRWALPPSCSPWSRSRAVTSTWCA